VVGPGRRNGCGPDPPGRGQGAPAVGPGTAGRVLVGLPERDLLIAAGLAEGDADFPALFAQYVADRAEAADEPIDDRVFELLDGELVEFVGI